VVNLWQMSHEYVSLLHVSLLLVLVQAQNIPHTFSCQHQQLKIHRLSCADNIFCCVHGVSNALESLSVTVGTSR
jgi:hypothetical protein